MNQGDFEQLVASHPVLAAHQDFLRGLVRPCVRIHITDRAPQGVQSRMGGVAMLPSDFAWPQHAVGVYRFLGQINFAEIEGRPACLPASGLLVLFHAEYDPGSEEPEEEIFWGDEGYVKAWYFEDLAALVPTRAPHGGSVAGRRITLSGELDLPRHRDLREDWPFDAAVLEAALDDGPDAMPGRPSPGALLACDYLLGHPSYYSLAYDPTPGPQWVSLLTLHSHEAFEWCWHDGDKLMVFIEQHRLAARDFSALQCDAG